MNVVLLLTHMLLSVALIGGITHQALGALAPVRKATGGFFNRFRAVNGAAYVNAIVILYFVTLILGLIIYPNYRIGARVAMEQFRLKASVGSFELKEHLSAIGLGLLPAYWWLWQPAQKAFTSSRRIVTLIIAIAVWYGFMVGHYLVNIRGITG